MKYLIALLCMVSLSVFGQLPYVTSPTNNPVDGFAVIRSGTTGGHNKWALAGQFVTNGTGITLTTNGNVITITATGTNAATVTNVVLQAGDVVVVTNSPNNWTVFNGLWTNDVDGPYPILRPRDQNTRMVEIYQHTGNPDALNVLFERTNKTGTLFSVASYGENLTTNSGPLLLYDSQGVIGVLGESIGQGSSILTGDAAGFYGLADSPFRMQYGGAALASAQVNNQTNIGFAASAVGGGKSGGILVGAYIETPVGALGGQTQPVFPSSSVLLLDSKDSGSPLITGNTNRFSVGADGNLNIIKGVTYTWPAAHAGTSGQILSSTTGGSLSWVNPGITNNDGSFVNYWQTNAADGSITNINPGSGIASVGGPAAPSHGTLTLDNLATTARLLVARSNSSTVFVVDGSGDLIRIKNIVYTWPATNSGANQLLANDGSGQLYWTNGSGGGGGSGQFVSAGTNVTMQTNGSVVTVNATGQTNFDVLNVGTINLTNPLPASIGPGTVNQLAKFINTTNVGDTRITEVATNMWAYQSSTSAYTNGMTNVWYERFINSTTNQGLRIVENGALAEITQYKSYDDGGGNIFGGMKLNAAWLINGLGTTNSGGHRGDWLPLQDAQTGLGNGLFVGDSSHRVRQFTAGSEGYVMGVSRTVPQLTWVANDIGVGAGFAIGGSDTNIMIYSTDHTTQVASYEASAGPSTSGAQWEMGVNGGIAGGAAYPGALSFMQAGYMGEWRLMTNNNQTAKGRFGRLHGAEGTGSDHAGGDLFLAGGKSTGTGTNGSVGFQTAEKAASTASTTNQPYTRMYVSAEATSLTTNSATTIATITLPTALTTFGAKIFASTHVDNGTDMTDVTEEILVNAANKAGTVTTSVASPANTTTISTGSSGATTVWSATASGTTVSIKCNVTTTGQNDTVATCRWQLQLNSGSVSVVTPF